MSRLAGIPIRIEPLVTPEPPVTGASLGGGVIAILSELVRLLEALAAGASSASIDLRSLPMSPQDRVQLQHLLGEGEVQATLKAQGVSRIRETQVSGVWWVEHFGPDDALVAESLEVTLVPAILQAAVDEIAAAAGDLRTRIERNHVTQ
jgi:hydrogenase-1 operon protein HyaF